MPRQSFPLRSVRAFVVSALTLSAIVACGESRSPLAPEVEVSFAKGGPSTDVPVISTVGAGSYASDGLGDYINGVSGVSSKFFPTGNYELSTQDRSTRRIRITFDSVTSGVVPFTATTSVQARFVANITLSPDGSTGFPAMTAGQSLRTPLAVPFTYGGKTYRLAMNPDNQGASEWAMATCEAGTPCTNWRITPTGANGRNSAVLIEIGKNNAETVRAVVRVSFDIAFRK